jgi:putative FmdB family regulatory protein
MPIYDYRCTACGREVEVMHGINETGPEACAHCGGTMRKALSSPAIHFKGSGWAKKDAASAKSKPASSSTSDSSESSPKGKDPGGKSESGEATKAGAASTPTTSEKSASAAGSTTD